MLNHTVSKKRFSQGFTLVELLIVVIILAILAAIVVPQFSSSTDDARSSSLDATLSNMRATIDLYQQQHGGRYPGAFKETDGTATTTDAERLAAFTAQLTLYSNALGVTSNVVAAGFRFGPYLKKTTLPVNPITQSGAIEFVTTGTLGMAGSGANLGWKYDVLSGQFIANDTTLDLNGVVGYDTH